MLENRNCVSPILRAIVGGEIPEEVPYEDPENLPYRRHGYILMLSGWGFPAHAADTPQPPGLAQQEKGMTTEPAPGEAQERALRRPTTPGPSGPSGLVGCQCVGGVGSCTIVKGESGGASCSKFTKDDLAPVRAATLPPSLPEVHLSRRKTLAPTEFPNSRVVGHAAWIARKTRFPD